MKTVLGFILGLIGVVVAIPLMIMFVLSILGMGAIAVTIPEVFVGILIVCLVISIPGILIGVIVGLLKK